jgi:Rrf2 family protein
MNAHFTIALHILGFLAAKKGAPLTSDILAKTYGTSPVVLRRVLSKLHSAGLVQTQRGAGGGSILARDPSQITLRQAYDAVKQGADILNRHPANCEGLMAPVLACYVNDLLAEAEQAMVATLDQITVAQMDIDVRTVLRQRGTCS